MNRVEAQALREPFHARAVGKLPRVSCSACSKSPSKHCDRHAMGKCADCGNWITAAHIHLDYVGHASVTDRLCAVDPDWYWEPLAFDEHGNPSIIVRDRDAWMWGRLTVAGATRVEVGTAPATAADLPKQLVSDFLRRAAMRFGVALDLWSREDLLPAAVDSVVDAPAPVGAPDPTPGAPTILVGLKQRARLLRPAELSAARKELGLPLLRDATPEELVKWETLIRRLEAKAGA